MDRVLQNKEINIVDFLCECVSKWRRFVYLLLGVIVSSVVILVSVLLPIDAKNVADKPIYETQVDYLTESLKASMENLAQMYKYNLVLKEEYAKGNNKLPLLERAKILSDIEQVDYFIEDILRRSTGAQQTYYYTLIGLNTVNTDVEHDEDIGSEIKLNLNIIDGMLIILITIVLHILITYVSYVFGSKVKFTDKLSSIIGGMDFLKCIDWGHIDEKRGLDRIAWKARLAKMRKIEIEKSEQINVATVSSMSSRLSMETITIVCGDLRHEADRLRELILKENKNLVVKIVNSTIYDVDGVKTLNNSDGVLLLARINCTNIKNLQEESLSLKYRGQRLLGVITYL